MNRLLYKLLRYSGLPWLFRRFLQPGRITILMFHDISVKGAEQAFDYLTSHYNIVSLEDVIQGNPMPSHPLVITFDDGHAGNHSLLPILKKYNLPTTIFLSAGIVNTRRHYWFTFRHPEYPTSILKKMPNALKLEVLREAGFSVDKEFETVQALSKQQIEEMKGIVDFQAHTLFHPCLPTCTHEEAETEILVCKERLEREFGLKVKAFAYPNGDYSDREVSLLKKAGYSAAVTVDYGFNKPETDKFRLKRLSVNDTENLDELIVKSSGVWGLFKSLIVR